MRMVITLETIHEDVLRLKKRVLWNGVGLDFDGIV